MRTTTPVKSFASSATTAPAKAPTAAPAPAPTPTPAPSRSLPSGKGDAPLPAQRAPKQGFNPNEVVSLVDGDVKPATTSDGRPILDANLLREQDKKQREKFRPKEDDSDEGETLLDPEDGELDSTITDGDEATPDKKKKKSEALVPEDSDTESDLDEEEITTDKPAAPAKRDYSIFSPEMADIAKRLPNAAYEKFRQHIPKLEAAAKEVEKLRTAAAQIPSFHFEHPDGYMLSKEWPQLQAAYSAYSGEAQHWEQQLYAIKSGEAWNDFLGYDDKGQPQYKQHAAPENGIIDHRAELHVQKALNRAIALRESASSEASKLIQGYSARVKEGKDTVAGLEKKFFPTIDLDALSTDEDKQSLSVINAMFDQLPAGFDKHPITNITKKLYIMTMRVANKGREWKEKLDRLEGRLKGKARAGNTKIPRAGEGEIKAGDTLNLDEIKKLGDS